MVPTGRQVHGRFSGCDAIAQRVTFQERLCRVSWRSTSGIGMPYYPGEVQLEYLQALFSSSFSSHAATGPTYNKSSQV